MLDDILVLDLSRILAGPYCTMTLADLGAEVIKVESHSGDDTRGWGPPFYEDDAAYFLCCNRNKKSLTLDFRTDQGQQILKKLAQRADVLVENYKVGGLKKYGLDYESIQKINPGIVYCSITGYGQTGPYKEKPGYDFIIQGMSGLMSITGEVEGMPMKVGVAMSDVLSAHSAITGILAALYRRQKTGEGEHIDISLLDSTVASLVNVASSHLVSGEEADRFGNAHPSIVPYETFQALDGHFNIGVGNNGQFARLCQALGMPELSEDERFQNNADRVQNRTLLVAQINEKTAQKPVNEWIEQLEAQQIPVGPILSIREIFENEQIQSRNLVTTVSHPTGGHLKLPQSHLKFKNHPMGPPTAPPLLGAQTEEILEKFLEMNAEEIQQLKKENVI